MTYFAKYVPNIDIIFQPDVTVVSSKISDDTFNYVLGAKFEEYNVKERVACILNYYRDLYFHLPLVLIAEGSPYEGYIGYTDGQPIVTGILILHANVAGIYYVMTVPQQRRKGYGTYVMKFLLNRAKEKGYHMTTLQASAEGRGLYGKLGFK